MKSGICNLFQDILSDKCLEISIHWENNESGILFKVLIRKVVWKSLKAALASKIMDRESCPGYWSRNPKIGQIPKILANVPKYWAIYQKLAKVPKCWANSQKLANLPKIGQSPNFFQQLEKAPHRDRKCFKIYQELFSMAWPMVPIKSCPTAFSMEMKRCCQQRPHQQARR